jgi:hypothetical protein
MGEFDLLSTVSALLDQHSKTRLNTPFLRRRWCWGVGQCVKPTNDRGSENT